MKNNLLHNSDVSLSDREIIQEKDNSIQNKSFYSTDLDFPDLVAKKEYFHIKIFEDEDKMDLSSKSIKKIFSLISGEGIKKLEDNYLDYITWIIDVENEIEKQELLTPNDKLDVIETNLEPSYYQLLSKTKIYYINIPKLNQLNQINKRIKLKDVSLGKISSFLGLNIFDISEFIEIFILSFQDKDILENKKSIKSKLLEKFNYQDNKGIEDFNIIKKLDLEIKESLKCKKSKLNNFEEYFEKVWNEIEKKNNTSNNFSEEDISSEKSDEENKKDINYEIPNNYNINKNFNNNNDTIPNMELREESGCAENICANVCYIF